MCVQLQDREDVAFFAAALEQSQRSKLIMRTHMTQTAARNPSGAHQAMTAMAAEKEAWLATFLPRRAGTLMRRRRRLKFLWFII